MSVSCDSSDAVRIKVIQSSFNEGGTQCCKFSVDPKITTLSVLQNLVARAFQIEREFELSYVVQDERLPEAVWVPLRSDFDLELSFARSVECPLLLKAEVCSHGSTGSSILSEKLDLKQRLPLADLSASAASNYGARLPGIFKEKVEKTIGLVQKALTWPDEVVESNSTTGKRTGTPLPLDDPKFKTFLDNVGVVQRDEELRQTVFMAGLQPSLRKVVWKLLLEIYPPGLNGKERIDFMKAKTQEYFSLRVVWQDLLKKSEKEVGEEVLSVCNMVRKDVLRTDRQHPFFSGADHNPNITALYNILTTYALNHPSVGYCQGMSDLASPLLVTQKDEAHAYICFCALMSRVARNFNIDGVAMSLKFQHLSEALLYYDPDFYYYLQENQADDLLFCYRWLLLELKREFVFDDALVMLEVLWASLPSRLNYSLKLFELPFRPTTPLLHPPTTSSEANCRGLLLCHRLNSNYDAVCALRRRTRSSAKIAARNVRRSLGSHHLTRTQSQPTTQRHRTLSSDACDTRYLAVEEISRNGAFIASASEGDETPCSKACDATPLESRDAKTVDGDSEQNVTPSRKVKNLKEFMLLGKSSPVKKCVHNCSASDVIRKSDINVKEKSVDSADETVSYTARNGDVFKVSSHRVKSSSKCEINRDDSALNTVERCDMKEILDDIAKHKDNNGVNAMKIVSGTSDSRYCSSATARRCFSESDSSEDQINSSDFYVEVWQNPAACSPVFENESYSPVFPAVSSFSSSGKSIDAAVKDHADGEQGWAVSVAGGVSKLPPPQEFGGGNPFLMIVCVSILLQHKEHVMAQRLDHNDLAMYFDKMVRRHDVHAVLEAARRRYQSYCNMHRRASTDHQHC